MMIILIFVFSVNRYRCPNFSSQLCRAINTCPKTWSPVVFIAGAGTINSCPTNCSPVCRKKQHLSQDRVSSCFHPAVPRPLLRWFTLLLFVYQTERNYKSSSLPFHSFVIHFLSFLLLSELGNIA